MAAVEVPTEAPGPPTITPTKSNHRVGHTKAPLSTSTTLKVVDWSKDNNLDELWKDIKTLQQQVLQATKRLDNNSSTISHLLAKGDQQEIAINQKLAAHKEQLDQMQRTTASHQAKLPNIIAQAVTQAGTEFIQQQQEPVQIRQDTQDRHMAQIMSMLTTLTQSLASPDNPNQEQHQISQQPKSPPNDRNCHTVGLL